MSDDSSAPAAVIPDSSVKSDPANASSFDSSVDVTKAQHIIASASPASNPASNPAVIPDSSSKSDPAAAGTCTCPAGNNGIEGTYEVNIKKKKPEVSATKTGGSRRRQRRQKQKSKKRANKRRTRSRSRSRSRK